MRNKILDKFAIDFINKNFEKIDLKKLCWEVTKLEAIKEIKENDFMAGWIITEVMSWGCEKDYLEEIRIKEDPLIIKVKGNFFQLDPSDFHCFYEVIEKEVKHIEFVRK